jgi:hypothetical protein
MTNASSAPRRASTHDRHVDIDRRYAWLAISNRVAGREKKRHDPQGFMARLRLHELERIFGRRYGYRLPDDDAGRDDLEIAAHHIAHLGGDVVDHVLAWAGLWAPWMPETEVRALALRVKANPQQWKAGTLAWRLRLTRAERSALDIRTIQAVDQTDSEREAARRERKRERDRARWRAKSNGRPRGRPRKNPRPIGDIDISGEDFSGQASDAARELPEVRPAAAASTQNQIGTSPGGGRQMLDLEEGSTAESPSTTSRAEPSQQNRVLSEPPQHVIEKAVEIADEYASHRGLHLRPAAVRRLLARFWPSYVEDQVRLFRRFYSHRGQFDPKRDLMTWPGSFRSVLDREDQAQERYRDRRRKWERERQRYRASQSDNRGAAQLNW